MAAHQLLPFAEQLRRYRRDRGLTQEELAEQAGLSARGIRALEQGERSSPHRDTVMLLADALGLAPEERAAFEEAASRAGPLSSVLGGAPALPSGGFLGAVPSGVLIGREVEMGRLLTVIDDVTKGIGRVVMLAGEPGIGKTRLAQEMTLHLRARGVLVATGQCYEPEQTVPYYPFLEALTAASRAAPPSLQAEIPQRWPHLERLLPDRAGGDQDSEIRGHDVQQVLFWAVSGFLQALAAVTPVALLLDDLHWADESTLKLFQHLARHLRADRLLLLGTYRDVDVAQAHPLERVLRDLHRDGLLEEVMVRRLNRQGTAALTAAILGETDISDDFAGLLHRHTDGNPFFTQEVVRALVERGDVFPRDGSWDRRAVEEIEIPRSIRSAVGERLSRLGEVSRETLREASVLGQAFTFADLQAMGDRGEEHVEAALGAAAAAGLVRVTGKDDYAFSHALVRQVLYDELSPRTRRRLHLAAGEALERLPEPIRQKRAPELAWHFAQADEPKRALSYSLLAGDGAKAVFAHAEAEQHYRTALDLARELGDISREAEALHKLSVVLRIVARYDEALEAVDRAVTLYLDVGDHEGEARTIHDLAFVLYYQGAADQGITRLRTVMDHLEGLPAATVSSRATAELNTALAFCLWSSARYAETLATAERAEEMARVANATRTLGIAQALHGMALTMIGVLAEARSVLQEAIPSLQMGDPWWLAQPWGSTGRAHVDEGDLQNGLRCLEQSRTLIEASHDPAEMAWILGNLGEVSYLRGDWSEARSAYERAIQVARDAGSDRYLSYALLHRAELCSMNGDWTQAAQDIDEGLEVARRCAAVPALRKAQRLLAEKDVMAGRPQSAIDRLKPLLGSPDEDWPRAFPPPVLAEAYLAVSDVARAEELVLQRVQRFREQNHRRALALWLRVQGMILGQQHQWEQADQIFAEAVSLAHAMPYPYAEGRSLHEYGVLHVQCGEPEQARERLEEALAIFRHLGARPDVERTEHALHALG
jgi:tetratricopeptide (TPR) repeat protein/DNA-binding XRE family transcriptional regulator